MSPWPASAMEQAVLRPAVQSWQILRKNFALRSICEQVGKSIFFQNEITKMKNFLKFFQMVERIDDKPFKGVDQHLSSLAANPRSSRQRSSLADQYIPVR